MCETQQLRSMLLIYSVNVYKLYTKMFTKGLKVPDTPNQRFKSTL